jgi:hypothetical protein
MTDRLVREVVRNSEPESPARPFSEFLGSPNIVLLGDPGAGKTHLFQSVSAPDRLYRARDFLNVDLNVLVKHKSVFIDGLDEKRAGRGDQNTIDAMVKRLGEAKPDKVRIACRAHDWLGESDLAAFSGYFEHAGGVVVLRLEALTDEERSAVLAQHGISPPAEFLKKAMEYGLGELLTNPQNLIMLADVVKKKGWPCNRGDLFSKAIEILLAEHNPNHTRQELGQYAATELLDAAGAICAARLIGDVDGISLTNVPLSGSLPSYRTVHFCEKEKVLAVLGRRAFVSGSVPESVDYVHRTIAEYLAARFIAQRIRAGLPLGRIRAVIGVDGKPASELRGLHAWLAVLLPEYARILIDADPYGVLNYGDAASLLPPVRQHLLVALGQLGEQDPWFRADNWSASPAIGAMSGPDMTEAFRRVLRGQDAGYTLRTIVLDALSTGFTTPDLIGDLVNVLLSSERSYRERVAALTALLKTSPGGAEAVASAYASLSSDAGELRIRAQVIRTLKSFSLLAPNEVSKLLNDAGRADAKLIGGVFWRLSEAVRTEDVVAVLKDWNPIPVNGDDRAASRNVSEVLLVVDELLVRYISLELTCSNAYLLESLEKRKQIADHSSYGRAERLRRALSSNANLLSSLITLGILRILEGTRKSSLRWDLSKLLVGAADDSTVLKSLIQLLGSGQPEENHRAIYEAAMACCFSIGEAARTDFEFLLSCADKVSFLQDVRESSCYWLIPDWRVDQNKSRRQAEAERDKGVSDTRTQFKEDYLAIQNGAHLGWLVWIAKVYFSLFSDLDEQASPRERLETQLGEESAQIAIAGLKALVLNGFKTPLSDVLDAYASDQSYVWSYAVLAGVDELSDDGELEKLPVAQLQCALALDLLYATYERGGSTAHPTDRPWKTRLFQEQPKSVVDLYRAVARAELQKNSVLTGSVSVLVKAPELAAYRAGVAADLLKEFPGASRFVLAELLPVAARECDLVQALELVRLGLEKCQTSGNKDSHGRWLAAGLILKFDEFKGVADALDRDERTSLIWALRDSLGLLSGGPSPLVLEYSAALAAAAFKRARPPEIGWSGDTNPWDATDYVLGVLRMLSSTTSVDGAQALERLLKDPATAEFHDDIRHAIAIQKTRRVDALFSQPTWSESLETLANGTPANIADLHALAISHLTDLCGIIASSNTDIYKRFWNEDTHGKPQSPKVEESCRDVLVDLLRVRLHPHGLSVEPEGHMANDKRADIAIFRPSMKLVIELKRDRHDEVWAAIETQLERFYTRDPEANGYGI